MSFNAWQWYRPAAGDEGPGYPPESDDHEIAKPLADPIAGSVAGGRFAWFGIAESRPAIKPIQVGGDLR